MRKFVIEKTRGNEEIIIKTFESRAAAMEFGEKYAGGLPRNEGVLTLAEREVDEQDRPLTNAERIYHIWR